MICCAALLGSGCSVADLSTTDRMERGLVTVLPGIEGRSRWNVNIARGLDEGGVELGIEIYDWGTSVPLGMLINLTDQERNRRAAEALRDHILAYRAEHPGKPVHLVGHSGGAGLAVMAVEMLPRDSGVTSLVLLAPALSPQHDLRRALRRTEAGIYNYYSKNDIGFLTLGTSVFGTMDRRYGASAGAIGFTRPRFFKRTDDALYDKLHQIRWNRRMRRYGHSGGHTGWADRRFVRRYLAPLISDLSSGGRPARLEPEPVADRSN